LGGVGTAALLAQNVLVPAAVSVVFGAQRSFAAAE